MARPAPTTSPRCFACGAGWTSRSLSAALDELVRRHEILRTVFGEEGGRPFQRVLPPAPQHLEIRDTSFQGLDEAIRAEAALPFDLARGPLLRASLLRLAPEDHRLLLVQHHLISDGWSIELLARELAALYANGPAGLPPPRLHYGDFAVWQAEAVSEQLIQLELAYWHDALDGWAPVELPADRPRRALPEHHGDQSHFKVPADTARALTALARARDTTLFVVLAAAFQVLLRIHARQDDVTIITALAGRTHLDLARLPGFFVNLVPLRTRFVGEPSFAALLAQLDMALHEALSHQDVPYERLVRELDIPREATGRTPLERVAFVLQTANAGPPPSMPGLEVEVTPEADQPIAKFELTFSLQARDDAIAGRVEYSTALYDRATIERLAEHYLRLLAAIARDPTARLSAATLLTADEFRRVVLGANRTAADYPRDAGLVELFERSVDRSPEAIAICDGVRRLTYAELDRRANALAQRLVALGVGARPEPMVALRLERSVELVVAILGILKAGAAYVPIDPRYPTPRARHMLDETRAAALIVTDRAAPGLIELTGPDCPLIALDERYEGEGRCPARASGADDLAYVCFTSGTTGAPKGVLVEQRAVARLVLGTDFVRLRPDQRMALASNPVFDAFTFEVWGALLNGATLVVIDADTLLDPEAVAAELAAERIDVLWLTTALFDQLAGQRPGMFRHLDTLLVGGGALNPAMIRAVLDCPAGAPRHLVNGYGPTENTTFSTTQAIRTVPSDARSIPIGRPIANSTAYVLDRDGNAVPPGVIGELHVGGDGLARGYLNDAIRTAERFVVRTIAHPEMAETIVARLYATGDLVRWRDDGTLEFLGRTDRQLKLHGFRVEPGEIEAAIAAHPAILEAAARAIEDDGQLRLGAWYACRPGHDLPEAELRAHLESRLPAYMVPAFLVRLPSLPTNAAGKIALEALPIPTTGAAEPLPADDSVAGRLLAIWRQVLRNEAVGLRDDFFRAGGEFDPLDPGRGQGARAGPAACPARYLRGAHDRAARDPNHRCDIGLRDGNEHLPAAAHAHPALVLRSRARRTRSLQPGFPVAAAAPHHGGAAGQSAGPADRPARRAPPALLA